MVEEEQMSIEGFIGGLMMIASSVTTGNLDSKTVWNTAVLIDKVNTKTEQGTWGASAHEESYQVVKDAIIKAGKR